MRHLDAWAATFFGAGFFPLAPGTFASLIAALAYRFWLGALPVVCVIGLIAAVFAVGVWASGRTAARLGRPDPRVIVIDEIAGQWTALLALPPDWFAVGAAFLLFRLFDIFKPLGIRRVERWPGGWGIMSDDIAAGLFALALGHVLGALR